MTLVFNIPLDIAVGFLRFLSEFSNDIWFQKSVAFHHNMIKINPGLAISSNKTSHLDGSQIIHIESIHDLRMIYKLPSLFDGMDNKYIDAKESSVQQMIMPSRINENLPKTDLLMRLYNIKVRYLERIIAKPLYMNMLSLFT